jgi:transcription elongation GreA/GreB family factor
MSKAFTDEEAPVPDDDALPPRHGRFPITPAGYARLQRELATLSHVAPGENGARRARALVQILESVDVVEPKLDDGRVGFGARVTIEDDAGHQTAYELVGPDEIEPAVRRISIASPVGQALRGKRVGERAVLRRPRGDVEVTVVAVDAT